ncbi:hypothetical protein FACS1894191_4160 [Clostridia bacterium]|nr:hypothetical protein FACS1894191_4160 [Clostridia bacterium]
MIKNKGLSRVLSVCLALCMAAVMLLALFPATTFAADIQAGTPTITVNTTVVGFAGQEWWVIGDASSGVYQQTDSVTLLHKGTGNNPETYGNTAFRTGQETSFSNSTQYSGDSWYYANNPSGASWTKPSDYRGSTLQQRMEVIASGINSASSKEYGLIDPRTLTAGDDANHPITGGDVTNQRLWALSYNEWQTIGNNPARAYGALWWLRSPYTFLTAFHGPSSGDNWGNLTVNSNAPAARPALNLKLSSVLFTSAASGTNAKPTTVGSLSAATAPTGAIKFTMEDTSVAPSFTASATARSGDTYTITYAGAATGAKNSVSAIVTRSGVMTYYGRLASPTSASATTTVTLPAGFDPATDTLKVFAEELNGDNYTDFATTPIAIDTTAPTLTAGDASRTSETAATVKFTSNEAGEYYYAVVESGAGALSIDTSGAGASCGTGASAFTHTLSSNSAKDIYIVVKDAAGNVSADTFKIAIPAYIPHISVTGITGVPATATAGTPLTLSGTVEPSDATNKTIVWSVNNAGTTGTTIAGNILSTTAAGTAKVTATISDGTAVGTDYAQDFDIVVNAAAALSNAKDITAFAINGIGGAISGTAISVTLPYGTAVTALTPTVTHSAASSYSPTGAQNFTSPVTYTVTAEDTTTKVYTVTVIVAASGNTAPTISGPDTIALTVGYADYTQAYTIAGNPAPTVEIDPANANTAGATITNTGLLTIPLGLSAGNYSTAIKATNSEGTATRTVAVNVSEGNTQPPPPPPPYTPPSGDNNSGGGSDRPDTPTYTQQTFTDTSGVIVTGRFTPGARLTVKANALHQSDTDAACNEIRERRANGEIIALFDIFVTGGYTGKLTVTIPVDAAHNGESAEILHCNSAQLETKNITIRNGTATGEFDKLSPFAVAIAATETPTTEGNMNPETGGGPADEANGNDNPNTGAGGLPDTGLGELPYTGDTSPAFIVLLIGAFLLSAGGIIFLLRHRKQAGE